MRRNSARSSAASHSSTQACGSSPSCARCRAFAELWTRITANRYGVTDATAAVPVWRAGRSLGLTEQQAENNVYRILIEMLAVTLSRKTRARAVQLPAWNEALGLPG
jgi:(2R)-ethylmalonyl-CoA mutase